MESHKRRKASKRSVAKPEQKPLKIEDASAVEKKYRLIVIAILIAVAACVAVNFYGHQILPNSDFTTFSHVGRDILSFDMPYSFKRVPLWGMLHVSLGWLMPGPHPEYTAALVLNTAFYIASAVLLYLIARQLLGKTAPWFTLIAMANPITLKMLGDPIVETCLVFFILATFCLILRRSPWAYLLACLTTMVRYEGAGLIAAAFIIDMITAPSMRKRLLSLLYAAAASIPMALWLIGTVYSGQSQTTGHYLASAGSRNINIIDSLSRIWQVTISPLLPSQTIDTQQQRIAPIPLVSAISGIIAVAAFMAATIQIFIKRNWLTLSLIIFVVLYIAAHELKAGGNNRYYMPISFAVLLIVCIGLKAMWRFRVCFLPTAGKTARFIGLTIIIALSIMAIVERFNFYGKVNRGITAQQVITDFQARQVRPTQAAFNQAVESKLARNSNLENQLLAAISSKATIVPMIMIAAALAFLALNYKFFAGKNIWPKLTLTIFIVFVLISNQFMLAQTLGKGDENIEFKRLLQWYPQNSQPGEKLAVEMASTLAIFAPERSDDLVHIRNITGDANSTFYDIIANCRHQSVRYIAWSSRLGLATGNTYHKRYGFDRIAPLRLPQDYGPCEFITTIRGNRPYRFINVFRIRQPQASSSNSP